MFLVYRRWELYLWAGLKVFHFIWIIVNLVQCHKTNSKWIRSPTIKAMLGPLPLILLAHNSLCFTISDVFYFFLSLQTCFYRSGKEKIWKFPNEFDVMIIQLFAHYLAAVCIFYTFTDNGSWYDIERSTLCFPIQILSHYNLQKFIYGAVLTSHSI